MTSVFESYQQHLPAIEALDRLSKDMERCETLRERVASSHTFDTQSKDGSTRTFDMTVLLTTMNKPAEDIDLVFPKIEWISDESDPQVLRAHHDVKDNLNCRHKDSSHSAPALGKRSRRNSHLVRSKSLKSSLCYLVGPPPKPLRVHRFVEAKSGSWGHFVYDSSDDEDLLDLKRCQKRATDE